MSAASADPSLPGGAAQRRWFLIGGVVVALVIAVVVVWALTGDGSDGDGASDGPASETAEVTGDAGEAAPTTATDVGESDSSAGSEEAPPAPPTTVTPTSGPPATAPVDASPVGVEELPPVGMGEPEDFASGLEVTVVDTERFEAEARAPGETAGPAVAVEIAAHNTGDETIDLIGVVVTATGPDGAPLIMNSTGPSDPFTGELAPGEARTATYVFRVDEPGTIVLRIEDAVSPEAVIVEL